MLEDANILVTGAAGQLGLPVARSLAANNNVWGASRLTAPAARDRLTSVGVRPTQLDVAAPDWASLPSTFDYVLHFAADIVGSDLDAAITTNAEGTGLLMQQFAGATFLVVSSTAVYDRHPDEEHRYVETDPLGDSKPLFGPTYAISKIAQEAAARTACRAFESPTVIARLQLSYGPNGGLPAYQLDSIRRGQPVTVADVDTFHSVFWEDDIVASIPKLLEVATVPATIVNWAGPDVVSMRTYCSYLAELVGTTIEFEPVADFMRSRATDISKQIELIGPSPTDWRSGMQQLVERRPAPATTP